MTCKKCNGKGYIESLHMHSKQATESAKICPECNDTKAYSEYIKGKHGGQETAQERVNRLLGR